MPKTFDPNKASTDDIEAELRRLSEEREANREQARKLTAALDERRTSEDAERRLANLSDPEKAALAQALKADGVKATTKTGTPGKG